MSLYNGPPRGGSRGGKDQFNWDNVKSDKFRENYLGASVHANIGRWQKGRDVFWYTREKQDHQASIDQELAEVKQREEDMMLEALGMKPKARKKVVMKARLDANEMKSLLQRGGPDTEEEEHAGQPPPEQDEEAVRGLGFASGSMRAMPALEAATERMEGTAMGDDPHPAAKHELEDQRAAAARSGAREGSEALARLRKLQKKAEKRAEKEAKKAKKKSKEKKEKKKKRKESSRRPSPSSDDSDSDEERRRGGGKADIGGIVSRGGGGDGHPDRVDTRRNDTSEPRQQRYRSRSRSPVAPHNRALRRSPPRSRPATYERGLEGQREGRPREGYHYHRHSRSRSRSRSPRQHRR